MKKAFPRVAARERFRPLLELQPSKRSPMIVGGILHAYGLMTKPEGELVWFERLLPPRVRLELARHPGLAPYAVSSAADVPLRRRSGRWRKLLEWRRDYARLDARRRLIFFKLLGTLCLYQDADRLDEAEPIWKSSGGLGEVEANFAFYRLVNRFMLRERELISDTSALLDVARRSPKKSRIRLIALLKYLTLNFEHKILSGPLSEASRLARKTLDDLEGVAPAERHAMESKYWRTVCYEPYFRGDAAEVDRRLDLAETAAGRAIEAAGKKSDFARGFAQENIHAVIATKAIVSLHRRDWATARQPLERMVALDPLGAWQRFGLGKALLRLGEAQRAAAQLEAGFALAPPVMDEGYALMAEALEILGRRAEAKGWKAQAADHKASGAVPPAAPSSRP